PDPAPSAATPGGVDGDAVARQAEPKRSRCLLAGPHPRTHARAARLPDARGRYSGSDDTVWACGPGGHQPRDGARIEDNGQGFSLSYIEPSPLGRAIQKPLDMSTPEP